MNSNMKRKLGGTKSQPGFIPSKFKISRINLQNLVPHKILCSSQTIVFIPFGILKMKYER